MAIFKECAHWTSNNYAIFALENIQTKIVIFKHVFDVAKTGIFRNNALTKNKDAKDAVKMGTKKRIAA